MKSIFLTILYFFATFAIASENCKIHPMLSHLVDSTESCYLYFAKRDSDLDGIPDWQRWKSDTRYIIPMDMDMDNDGIPNSLDREITIKNKATSAFPTHLLDRDNNYNKLQLRLHKATGLYAIQHSAKFNRAIIEDIIKIYTTMLQITQQEPRKLKYIYAVSLNKRSLAYYIEPLDAIAVNIPALKYHPNRLNILAHEFGHAYIFSYLTPDKLAHIAQNKGKWNIKTKPESFYDKAFLERYKGEATSAKSFPSTYAYNNIHEWFSENFAQQIEEKILDSSNAKLVYTSVLIK